MNLIRFMIDDSLSNQAILYFVAQLKCLPMLSNCYCHQLQQQITDYH